MKKYAVIGLGRFGLQVAKRLYEYGEDVLAIDRHEDLINTVADHVSRAVVADAKNKETLKSLGVAMCDCVIVALGSDFASSVLVTMNLKSLGVRQIICKAQDDTHREILEKIGADKVIIPEREMADKIARLLSSPNILEYIELSSDHGIVEFKTPSSWIGKSLRELNIRQKFGVNVISVKHGDDVIYSFDADFVFPDPSSVVLLGNDKALEKIEKTK